MCCSEVSKWYDASGIVSSIGQFTESMVLTYILLSSQADIQKPAGKII
jgi:hypothetical protein